MKLPKFLRRAKPVELVFDPKARLGITNILEEIAKPVPPPKPKPRGRVIKQTRHSEFDPNSVRGGGRIVKVMPRQLQKIKQAQEMVESDDKPSVEDLEE
jgi:translation elongation factor EF-4